MKSISIIVPIYKGEKYINKIIQSVENNYSYCTANGMDVKIEIIFVNDYPEKYLDTNIYNKNFSILVVNKKQNEGIHKTRLIGLKKSKSEYVLFLDQDDDIESYYIYSQLSKIGNEDAVLCNGYYRGNKKIYNDELAQNSAVNFLQYLSQKVVIISPGQVVIRREAIPRKWSSIVLEKNGSDDVLLWILMLKHKCRFVINEECLYYHNEDGDNASLNFSSMKDSVVELKMVIEKLDIISKEEWLIIEESLDNRILKYNCYEKLLASWNIIISWIRNNISQDNSLAVYGYGIIGKKLITELESEGYKLSYVFDSQAAQYNDSRIILNLFDNDIIVQDIDFIINTVVFDKKINNILFNKIKGCKVIALDEIM